MLAEIDEDAEVTSDCKASAPTSIVPSDKRRVANVQTSEALRPVDNCFPIVPAFVRVEVAMFHTSEAREPKVVRVRVPFSQTAVGMVEAREVEAVNTVASVCALIVDIAEVNCESVCAFTSVVT